MEALSYQPNVAARAMRTNSSKTIGLLIPDMSCPVFIRVAIGAEEVLAEHGYVLFTFSSNRQESRELAFLRAARQRQMDGLIISLADEQSSETVRELRQMGVPMVVVDRDVPVDADVVLNEHFSAMEMLMQNLIGLGHRRIGLVCAPMNIRPGRERVRAYRDVLAKAGIEIDDTLIRATGQGHDYGAAEAHDILTSAEPPTALIAAGSDTFYGALRAIRGLRLDIPSDISFVGADDAHVGDICAPPITMIERDMRQVGRMAAGLLLERFKGVSLPPRRVMLDSRVVLRSSLAPASAGKKPAQRKISASFAS